VNVDLVTGLGLAHALGGSDDFGREVLYRVLVRYTRYPGMQLSWGILASLLMISATAAVANARSSVTFMLCGSKCVDVDFGV